jgi:PatG Domain
MTQQYCQPSFLLLIQTDPTGYPFQGGRAFRFRDPDVLGFAIGHVSRLVGVYAASLGAIGFAFEQRGLVLSTCIRLVESRRASLASRWRRNSLTAGRAETAGQTDQQAFHNVLSKPESRYLARQLCWVLMIQGLETYIVQPRDPKDFDRLVEASVHNRVRWTSMS